MSNTESPLGTNQERVMPSNNNTDQTIEQLDEQYNDGVKASSGASLNDVIKKVNELVNIQNQLTNPTERSE